MGCLVAVILFIIAFATIPLPPIAIFFLGLAILSAIKAMKGDRKDGTFSERWGREIDSEFGKSLFVFVAIAGLIIIFIIIIS